MGVVKLYCKWANLLACLLTADHYWLCKLIQYYLIEQTDCGFNNVVWGVFIRKKERNLQWPHFSSMMIDYWKLYCCLIITMALSCALARIGGRICLNFLISREVVCIIILIFRREVGLLQVSHRATLLMWFRITLVAHSFGVMCVASKLQSRPSKTKVKNCPE